MDKDIFIKNCFNMVGLLRDKFNIDQEVKIRDIPSSYFMILDVIDHETVITVTELAEHLGISQSNCSRSVNKLVLKGLIDKKEYMDDRRVYDLTLSKKGKGIINENNERIHQEIIEKMELYGEKELLH
ncbi:MarR family winged helix-turn-helix transcriptional regulator [Oceanirhabdus seepicola]|uniref:MarR family transcriptional regulator n=1 Tax=Oceanirhabdus seepicola TaxID=2828781 RepID=A0A9J6NX96_9CLOT|nr:MarR family transcriptional regulator [Oceanirhabdus seepicola]MCM1988684.1 MarR family transcriptional regulator [Oceanirhabdus seepicola]